MKLKHTVLAATTAACMSLPSIAFAHGGVYRGPGDTVPPGTDPGGGRSGGGRGGPISGPNGPSGPGPGAPQPGRTTGGGSGPTTGPGGSTGRTGRGGIELSEDLTRWVYWWEFNKDPFLQLKSRIWSGAVISRGDEIALGRGDEMAAQPSLRPSKNDLMSRVVPALRRALKNPSFNRDVVSSSLIALARIGRDDAVLRELRGFLGHGDQEVKETAAIAMGSTAREAGLDDLLEIVRDSRAGRALCKRASGVRFRERSFAAYACGLIAHASTDLAIKRKVFDTMRNVLQDKRSSRRDVKVGALQAIRQLRVQDGEETQSFRDEVVDFLLAYSQKGEVYAQVRAHAVDALARLLGRSSMSNPEAQAKVLERARSILTKKSESNYLRQSAVLMLGQVTDATDTKSSELLQTQAKKAKDTQVRRFAMMALGQIGGSANQIFLRKRLAKAKSDAMPWAALALAVSMHNKHDDSAQRAAVIDEIKREYRDTANPDTTAGLAIALGILRARSSEDLLLRGLLRFKNNDECAGYHALALGLIGSSFAKSDIRQVLEGAKRRETLLTQCSVALGLLGDKQVGLDLVTRLGDGSNTVAVSSALSQALGFIGDRRSIDSLVTLLDDRRAKNIPRAFAAVALGRIGDKERLPWNSKIAVNINYRANFETLTGSSTGILDLL